MTNLLENAGFEADWGDEKSHRCLVLRPGAPPERRDVDNIFTPPGWLTWFRHDPGTWDQPEVRDAWRQGDPRRVHGGEKGILLFTFYRKHDAGFLQQVQVTPGQHLQLTAWAHAWSNWQDGDHPDDPRWSDGPGYAAGFAFAGDVEDDNWRNFTFQVGIDPTGGTDPFAGTVVWGPGAHIYNEHAQVPPVVVTATSSTITIFLRSKTLWTFKHNDAYWDDVTLVVTDEPPDLPEPEPDPVRGQPRVQYERTYVLLPPNADVAVGLAVVDATWDAYRYTIGGSADDAGIGDLEARRVIAINPAQWDGDLAAFFKTYYPGVKYRPLVFETEYQLRGRLLAYDLKDMGFRLAYPTTFRPPHVTDEFGRWRGSYHHCGLDLRSSWAVYGDEILSATDGVVVEAGWHNNQGGFGYRVRVKCLAPDGRFVYVRYAHFTSDGVYVEIGDVVQVGQKLGRPGSTGVSTADHLHFDVWCEGEYVDPAILIDWGGDYEVDESYTLRGVHDRAGADWLVDEGLAGWCLLATYLGTDAQDLHLGGYDAARVRMLVNARFSYALDDGGQGTMPAPGDLAAFEGAYLETMRRNPAAWAFIYCNEMNNSREWPDGYVLTPEYYVQSFNRVWAAKPAGMRLFLGAIDPFNSGWGDWRQCWRWVMDNITDCDGLAMHAYTHGPELGLIEGHRQFSDAPLTGVYYDLRVLESQQEIVPPRFQSKPIVVTETNHFTRENGDIGWDSDTGEWVRQAYRYFAQRGVQGACLFRFNHNDWRFGDKPQVLEALREVGGGQ